MERINPFLSWEGISSQLPAYLEQMASSANSTLQHYFSSPKSDLELRCLGVILTLGGLFAAYKAAQACKRAVGAFLWAGVSVALLSPLYFALKKQGLLEKLL